MKNVSMYFSYTLRFSCSIITNEFTIRVRSKYEKSIRKTKNTRYMYKIDDLRHLIKHAKQKE